MRITWKQERPYQDILYETAEGMAKITINRPQVRNAFRPQTLFELQDAFARAREDQDVGVIIFIGGGHVLHLVCDLTIAAENAVFGQTGPKVGSFDAGYGATLLARIVGHKKAREIWYLCRQYSAQEALDMGLVNAVVPLEQLEEETVAWCREVLEKSPTALRFLKASFNADTDGLAGIQQLAGDATLLYYLTDEAKEGRNAFLEKRKPDFSKFQKFP